MQTNVHLPGAAIEEDGVGPGTVSEVARKRYVARGASESEARL